MWCIIVVVMYSQRNQYYKIRLKCVYHNTQNVNGQYQNLFYGDTSRNIEVAKAEKLAIWPCGWYADDDLGWNSMLLSFPLIALSNLSYKPQTTSFIMAQRINVEFKDSKELKYMFCRWKLSIP